MLGDIVLRMVKTVERSVMKIFDDFGYLYRTAIMVGVEFNSQQFKGRLIR